ncbi:MAG: DUF5615 family PIN-like protein [Pirellulales bacterium]|nr:DUF5615 family PIN-like protein [Pirellulales bacterium]
MTSPLRIKLDENLGNRGAAMFRAAGHDVATIYEERLTSASDQKVSKRAGRRKDVSSRWTAILPTHSFLILPSIRASMSCGSPRKSPRIC